MEMCRMRLYSYLCTMALLSAVAAMPKNDAIRPIYIDCIKTDECGKSTCCRIGLGRYSTPTCMPMGELGDRCTMPGHPISTNITYPDGSFISLSNVYINICPCSIGLTCSPQTSVCADPNLLSYNYIDY